MKKLPSLSAFFPCYNDSSTIGTVVCKARSALEQVTDDYEIIVINDGSTDDSSAELHRLMSSTPRLHVVTHPRNLGYGGALRSGFAAASKEYVFYTDGDGQYDPGELVRLVEVMDDRTDLVNGYKITRSDPFYRKVVGNAYRAFVSRAFRLGVRDVDCDFRLIRRSMLANLKWRINSGAFCVELVKSLQGRGARIKEVPVHHYPRGHGRSQFFRPARIAATLRDLVYLWWSTVGRSWYHARK